MAPMTSLPIYLLVISFFLNALSEGQMKSKKRILYEAKSSSKFLQLVCEICIQHIEYQSIEFCFYDLCDCQ